MGIISIIIWLLIIYIVYRLFFKKTAKKSVRDDFVHFEKCVRCGRMLSPAESVGQKYCSNCTVYLKMLHEQRPLKPLQPWSFSKLQTAEYCMYKFKRVYLDGIREDMFHLKLGREIHEILALSMRSQAYSPTYLEPYKNSETYNDLSAMVVKIDSFITTFQRMFPAHYFGVETKLAISSFDDTRPIGFDNSNAFFRGIIDLWVISPSKDHLIILDHKSSKKAIPEHEFNNDFQLNTYAVLLAVEKISKGDPIKKITLGHHYTRTNRIITRDIDARNIHSYIPVIKDRVRIAEKKVNDAYQNDNWSRNYNSYVRCKYCYFYNECYSR